MDVLKSRRWLRGRLVVLLLLSAVSIGSTCEAPSSPQCFRRRAADNVYLCEWSLNTTHSNATYDLHVNNTQFPNIRTTWSKIPDDRLIRGRLVNIWVEARLGNRSCSSGTTSVVLMNTVKYEAPQNIKMSWEENSLVLNWTAPEKHPAFAEVRLRQDGRPTESWDIRRTFTTLYAFVEYQVHVVDLNHTPYQVQIRHRSNRASNSLWSDWCPVVTVPTEPKHKPNVSVTTRLVPGGREVMLTWTSMPQVKYNVTDTSHGCPCKVEHNNTSSPYIMYVSDSAVNISVFAANAAGRSPAAILRVPARPVDQLKTCDKTLLDQRLNKSCLELFELQDGESRPENVIRLKGGMRKKDQRQVRRAVRDFVRYRYLEHRCEGRKPKTVKTCLFYQKEGSPRRPPLDLRSSGETLSSVDVSWGPIPIEDQQGFLTHYSLCSMKISSHLEPGECQTVPASQTKHRLDHLTPGSRYNVSLAGATSVGEGPNATITVSTLPKTPANALLWSLSFLFVFFLFSTTCIFITQRVKNRIFPPVPTPVIPNLTAGQPESQEMLEGKEEVDVLTLHQLQTEDMGDASVLRGRWDEDVDEETVDNQISMLTYRNGLVFDTKADSEHL